MKGIRLDGRKGVTVWDLSSVAFTLVFIAIALSVGLWTNEQVAVTAYVATNMNDSITFTNDTFSQLSYRARNVNYVENATDRIGAENWTTTVVGYQTYVKCYFDVDKQAGDYNVNYDALNSSAHFATMNATEGMTKMAQWLPIVMVVIAAAIVIAALAMWFGKR